MAGLIEVNKDKVWSVAGWVFDHVLRQTLPHIPAGSQELSSVLRGATVNRLNYVDAGRFTTAEKRVLLGALRDGLRDTEEGGSGAFGDPAFYPGFIDRFKELIDLLSSDLNEPGEGVKHDDEI